MRVAEEVGRAGPRGACRPVRGRPYAAIQPYGWLAMVKALGARVCTYLHAAVERGRARPGV